MQQIQRKARRRAIAVCALAAIVLWWGRALVWLAAKQLFLGLLTALAAMPVMKQLEKRLPAGLSAALAIAGLNMVLAAAFFWLAPAAAEQARQLAAMLPGLWKRVEEISTEVQRRLADHGLVMNTQAQTAILEQVQGALGSAVPAVISRLGGLAGGVGQWLLAPVFGFYFLRDRRQICRWLLSLLPVGLRGTAVHMLREMRRETAGYLRGQLMLSAAVGGLSAVGFMLCGVPSWLALGLLTGLMELIPYIGPVIGGAVAALFALPLGLWRALWAVGVVLVVQQLEGSVLTPRFISRTTQLHPAGVILCAVVGGAAAGVTGILLSVPLVLCIRAAFRVALLHLPPQK